MSGKLNMAQFQALCFNGGVLGGVERYLRHQLKAINRFLAAFGRRGYGKGTTPHISKYTSGSVASLMR